MSAASTAGGVPTVGSPGWHRRGAHLMGLAGLPGMGPVRLAALLARWSPEEAWAAIADGRAGADPGVAAACRGEAAATERWRAAQAAPDDLAERWREHLGLHPVLPGDPGWPPALDTDPEPPALLFRSGHAPDWQRPAAAVVGTRRCTAYGRLVARRLGRELAAAGVTVVSGLALGIDGAAHTGALEAYDADGAAAPPLGITATGLDVVYPRRHRQLWASVAEAGAILSEVPLGTPPERWRFPARNRIIAALAQVLVVVESHAAGGSLHTAEAALDRGRPVLGVPGPVTGHASDGVHELLASGAGVCRNSTDVLDALGLSSPPPPRPGRPDHDRGVWEALGWEPTAVDTVCLRTGLALAEVALALRALERDGWACRDGPWWQRSLPDSGGHPAPTGG